MSLVGLGASAGQRQVSARLAQRADMAAAGQRGSRQESFEAAMMTEEAEALAGRARGGALAIDNERDGWIGGLTQYIPGETITFLVACVSVKETFTAPAWWMGLAVYAFWAVATPLIVLMSAHARFLQAAKANNLPRTGFTWPKFPMMAGLIAFIPWGLSVPGVIDYPPDSQMREIVSVTLPVVALILTPLLAYLELLWGDYQPQEPAADP